MNGSEAWPTISALEKVPRKKEYLARLSDGSVLKVTDEDLPRFSLAPGIGLSADLIEEIRCAYEYATVKQSALRLVKVRPRTEGELARSLRSRGFAEPAVARVLGDLTQAGVVDDGVFARLWVAERVRKGIGRKRILAELRKRLVNEAIARDELARSYSAADEVGAAQRTALKRLARVGSLPGEKRAQRVYTYLLRQGFDSEVAREATRSAVRSSGEKGEE